MTDTPPARSAPAHDAAPSAAEGLRLGRLVRLGASPTRPGDEGAGDLLLARRTEREQLEAQLPDLVQLARLLAGRIVGEALATSDGALAHWAGQVLDEARGARRLRLFAAPADLERLRPILAELALDDRDVSLSAAPDMQIGTLRLETELGELHADVEPALARLAAVARRRAP